MLVETFKGALTLKTTSATGEFWEEFQSRFGRLANLAYRTTQIGIVNTVFSSLVSGIGESFYSGLAVRLSSAENSPLVNCLHLPA